MSERIVAIQYLRAIAATMVLASHAFLYPLESGGMFYGRLGWLGVILFFVVSGFIIVNVTGRGAFDGVRFFGRRVVRVVPMYWAVTLVAATLAFFEPQLFKTTVFDGIELLLSLGFIPFYNAASHGIHPLYKLGWTLNYEMFFYVCFALLAVRTAGGRVRTLTLAYAGLALVGLFFHPQGAIPQFYTSYMPLAFIGGCWIGLGHLNGRISVLGRPAIVALSMIAIIGMIEGFAWDRGVVEDVTAFVGFLSFAVVLVILALRFSTVLPRLNWLERLGDASYSVYLVHIFAVALTAGIGLHYLGTDKPWVVTSAILISIASGIVIGLLVYRYIERPLLGRLRSITELTTPQPVPQPEPD